ncbi:unnamed protein product [Adineta steineri]|uniref:Beta-ketoacyl synthase-like N-terminal domain-containing protein n=1 Tax=Adineta steineri TaxID=433720 RepID=A0A813VM94_9BILA|nr:unnamed protein product [Adineta steineri]
MSQITSSSIFLEPVAIVGMACEFAGDIHCPNDLWQALKESRDVGSAIPRDRVDLESYCAHMFNMDNHGQFHDKLIRAGYFLSVFDIRIKRKLLFSNEFFDISI